MSYFLHIHIHELRFVPTLLIGHEIFGLWGSAVGKCHWLQKKRCKGQPTEVSALYKWEGVFGIIVCKMLLLGVKA